MHPTLADDHMLRTDSAFSTLSEHYHLVTVVSGQGPPICCNVYPAVTLWFAMDNGFLELFIHYK